MSKYKPDVHTEHCCLKHGCKYSDPKCTVTTGKKPQSYDCEECGYDNISFTDNIYETFLFCKHNLRISVEDDSHGANYEVPGSMGVRVVLSLRNPRTGEWETISESSCSIG